MQGSRKKNQYKRQRRIGTRRHRLHVVKMLHVRVGVRVRVRGITFGMCSVVLGRGGAVPRQRKEDWRTFIKT